MSLSDVRPPRPVDVAVSADPSLLIGALLHCTGAPPDVKDLRTHIAERLSAVPALTTAISGDESEPQWSTLAPDLERHVRSRPVPPGNSVDDATRELLKTELPAGGPLWDITLLYGHDPQQYVLLYRAHHCVQDFGGVVHALETLFGTSPIAPEQSAAVSRSFIGVPRPSLRHRASAAARFARTTARSTRWPHPGYGHSDVSELRWVSLPDTSLRSAARPYGGTANDAYLAALSLAVLDWEAAHRTEPVTAKVVVNTPVNMRRPPEAGAPGNYAMPVPVVLPGRALPPSAYLAETVRATAWVKFPQHREALRRLTDAIPSALYWKFILAFSTPRHTGLFASHFVIRHQLAFKDDPVERIVPFTIRPGSAPLSVLLLRYRGTATACFVTDSVLPDMDTIHLRWRDVLTSFA